MYVKDKSIFQRFAYIDFVKPTWFESSIRARGLDDLRELSNKWFTTVRPQGLLNTRRSFVVEESEEEV